MQTLAAGNKVYCPSISNDILDTADYMDGYLAVMAGGLRLIVINKTGLAVDFGVNPVAFLATEENYNKLVYTYPFLEKPKKVMTGNEIAEWLLNNGKAGVVCYRSDASYENAHERKEISLIVKADKRGGYGNNRSYHWNYLVPLNLDTMQPYTQQELGL